VVLERAIARQPDNTAIKEQLANILIMSGNLEQAAGVLSKINVFRGHQALAGMYMLRGDLPQAETQLRKMLQDYPVGYHSPDGTIVTADDVRKTELMLGNVLDREALKRVGEASAFAASIQHYQKMEKSYPNDKEVPAALGHVYLWSGERAANKNDKDEAYASALKQFHKVLTAKNWSAEPKSPASRGNVEQGFIDAAASAPTVTAEHAAVAREIAARRLAGPVPEPVGAARLAWVLVQTKDPQARNDGLELLRRAAAANPTKEEDRRELAGVFAAAGEYKTAAEILAPMGNSVADTLKVAELYAG